jgi:glyoxylase-like metal-dependent hydrolase (beta-lactamase superfamily II)
VTTVPTAHAVSPDSGAYWTESGPWRVDDGIHRIPLPLPMDGLRAVNVYLLETADGLTLIDGGWAVQEARVELQRALAALGYAFKDIRQFLVTHAHRDHYTLAAVLGSEYGAGTLLGAQEKPAIDLVHRPDELGPTPFDDELRRCGAGSLVTEWVRMEQHLPPPNQWPYPSRWLTHDQRLVVGDRVLEAVHTPGHTPGHYVFADAAAGLLFAGDHVLPTITPSIGFTLPMPRNPLGDFLDSLAKLRSRPDLQVLPAHGPVGASMHARIDELVDHHQTRLQHVLAEVGGAATPYEVAMRLTWTRHQRGFGELEVFDRGMAVMETRAHLDLLMARGVVSRTEHGGCRVYTRVAH